MVREVKGAAGRAGVSRHLLILINKLDCGGTQRFTATLSEGLVARGWRVTVACLAAEHEAFMPLPCAVERRLLAVSGDSANLAEALWNNFRRMTTIRGMVKELAPDAVLATSATLSILAGMATVGIREVRKVGAERGHPPTTLPAPFWTALRKRAYALLDAVTCLTPEAAAWVAANTNARRTVAIPNAVPWPFPVNQPVMAPVDVLPLHRKLVLGAGRLVEVKGFELLIRAFSKLATMHGEWDLVIVGEGPRRGELEALVAAEGLCGRVHLPGLVGNIGEWYRRADLFVLSSLSEGFANVLSEALAHGVAAVAFDCDDGPRHIVRHGIDGLLVPANDEVALADALARVMGDNGLRERLAARAREARERFHPDPLCGAWEKLFMGSAVLPEGREPFTAAVRAGPIAKLATSPGSNTSDKRTRRVE